MKKLLAILLVMLTSCTISYKFNGASINYNLIKTISVSDFPIRAALVYPPLEEVFSNKLKDAYTRQTRLQMVDTNGDLQVSGEITGYNLTPQAVGTDAYATMTRLTISVKVTFINTKDPQFDFENRTFSAYQDFSSDRMLTDVQDELIDVITEEECQMLMRTLIDEIQIFEDKQPDGRIVKSVKLSIPVVYDGEISARIGLDKNDHDESVVCLVREQI